MSQQRYQTCNTELASRPSVFTVSKTAGTSTIPPLTLTSGLAATKVGEGEPQAPPNGDDRLTRSSNKIQNCRDSATPVNTEPIFRNSDSINHDSDAFTEVKYKKGKRKGSKPRSTDAVVGTAITKASCPLVAAPKRIWLHVSRLSHEATQDDDVLEYLRSKIPNVVFECEKLKTLGANSAFKICAPHNLHAELNDPSFWPAGSMVRRFFLPVKRHPEAN